MLTKLTALLYPLNRDLMVNRRKFEQPGPAEQNNGDFIKTINFCHVGILYDILFVNLWCTSRKQKKNLS